MKSSTIFYVLLITALVNQKISASAPEQPQTDKKEEQVDTVISQPITPQKGTKPSTGVSTKPKQFWRHLPTGVAYLLEDDGKGNISVIGSVPP